MIVIIYYYAIFPKEVTAHTPTNRMFVPLALKKKKSANLMDRKLYIV